MLNAERRRVRDRLLTSSAAVVMATALLAPSVAHAAPADPTAACGPLNGTVVCTPANNPYTNGIKYTTTGTEPDPVDLTVVLQPGVDVQYQPTTPYARAVIAYNYGNGRVSLDAAGASIRTSGVSQYGVGIGGYGTGGVTATAGQIATTGNNAVGMFGFSFGGDLTLTGGTITTSGASAHGIAAQAIAGAGTVTVTSGDITTSGRGADGVNVLNRGTGAVNVTVSGTIALEGDNSRGVAVTSSSAPASVAVDGLIHGTGTGETGVRMTAATASLGVAGAIVMDGAYSTAARVSGTDGASANVDGTIAATGFYSNGLIVRSANGAASLTGAGSIKADGLGASLSGQSVSVNFNRIASGGTALSANSYGAGGIDITLGSAFADRDYANAIRAYAAYSAPISITVGSATAVNSNAVFAKTDGTIAIDVGDASASRGSTIAAIGGENDVTVRGTVTSNAAPADGYYNAAIRMSGGESDAVLNGDVPTPSGNSTLHNGGVIVTAYDRVQGVRITGIGNATVDGDGSITTYGANASGIFAHVDGDVNIAAKDITTVGDGSFAIDAAGRSVALDLTGAISSSGNMNRSDGAVVSAVAIGTDPTIPGNGNVTIVNDGTISSSGAYARGINARATGDIAISGGGSVSTSGYLATGIAAVAAGDVSVAQGSVDAATARYGVIASSTGGGDVAVDLTSVSVNNPLDGLGAAVFGIGYGNVSIAAGSVDAVGSGTFGLLGVSRGAGDVSITADTVRVDNGYGNGGAHGGIWAQSASGNISISAGTVETFGDNALGITAVPYGTSIATISANNVTTHGDGSSGILVNGGSNTTINLNVTGTVETFGDNATAVYGPGIGPNETITVNNLITHGNNSYGLDINPSNANVTVNGSVTTYGAGSIGLRVGCPEVVFAKLNVLGDVTTSGDDAFGVAVLSYGTAELTTTGAVKTTGNHAYGIYLKSGQYFRPVSGPVTVSAASIETHGNYSNGIEIRQFGNSTTDATIGTVVTTGALSRGVNVGQIGAADVNLSVGSVTTSGLGAIGIDVQRGSGFADAVATKGDINLAVGSVTTGGDYAVGIYAHTIASGLVRVAVTGDVTTSGRLAPGVALYALNGGAGAYVNNVSVSGAESAAVAVRAYNALAITYGAIVSSSNRTTALSGQYAAAVQVSSTALNFGAYGHATVANYGTIQTSGDNNGGIAVAAGLETVVDGSGTVATTGSGATGIFAFGLGSVSVKQSSVTTADAIAVAAASQGGGDVSVDIPTVVAGGTQRVGIYAASTGTGSVSITNQSTLAQGQNSIGIYAAVERGNVTINSGTVQAGAAGGTGSDAIHVVTRGTAGTATIASTGPIVTAGDAARGIFVGAVDPTAGTFDSVKITAGNITTTGVNSNAIDVRANAIDVALTGTITTSGDVANAGTVRLIAVPETGGSITASNTGTIRSSGADSDGIFSVATGTIAIANSGTISAQGTRAYGITARGLSGVAISGTGSIATNGARATGIYAVSQGAVSVAQRTVTTTGQDASAILAQGASVTVAVANASATGAASANNPYPFAVGAAALVGDADVTVGSVAGTGAGMSAIGVQAKGKATITVGSGGVVTGAVAGIRATSLNGITLTNAGTITGGAAALSFAYGVGSTINNSGTIAGTVLLTDGVDVLNNTGLVRFGAGSSFGAGNDVLNNAGNVVLTSNLDFGAGTDAFNNSGTLTVTGLTASASAPAARLGDLLAAALAAPASVTLTGLEAFNNIGTITLANGTAGDTLTIPGTFTGSGKSALLLDVNATATAPTADRLVIGGAATGSTVVTLNYLNAQPVLSPGVTLVQAGAGTSSTAFSLSPTSVDRGLIGYGLVYDGANNRFTLVGAPNASAARLLNVSEGAIALAQGSSDAVTNQLQSSRDTGVDSTGLWLQIFGNVATRDQSRTFTTFGLTRTADLSYRQDAFGGQAGLGFGGGGFTFGVTGGYENSRLHARGAGERVDYDVYNVGGYLALDAGAFFVNALAKYDRYEIDLRSVAAGYRLSTSGDGYTGRAEAGLRLGGSRFWAEPKVGISYVRANLDGVNTGAVATDFADAEGLRGTAGLRLGGQVGVATLYAAGDWVHEFDGKNGITLTSGATSVSYRNIPVEDYAKLKLGVSIDSGPISGFIQGEGVVGDGYSGGGARVGIRFRF